MTKQNQVIIKLPEDCPPAFVTYGWCRSSYNIVRSLGRKGISVHTGDDSSLAMSKYSRYVKSFTLLPNLFEEPEKFFEEVCNALQETGAKVLLPGHEDVGIFSRRIDELPEGVKVALPEWESYFKAEDKYEIMMTAEKVGCPVPYVVKNTPESYRENGLKIKKWPVVLKTRVGNGAKGVRVVDNYEDYILMVKELVDTFELDDDRWPFIQEFLPGDAAGVCLLYIQGECILSFAEKYLRCKEPGSYGTSTFRTSFFNEELISQARAVMDKLKWHGMAHLDFVSDENGIYKMIEINPRPWGALGLAYHAGVDFPLLWYLAAIGSNNHINIHEYEKVYTRWLIGDGLAFAFLLKRRMFYEALKVLIPRWKCYHDDFYWSDPLPFFIEAADYINKFFKSKGNMNPVIDGMIR